MDPLIDKIFGSWKVIEYNSEESFLQRKSMYTCECIHCSKIRFIRKSNLREDRSQICRCQSRKDLTGQIFNSYKVLEFAEEESRNSGRTKYLCECLKCNNLNIVDAANLKSGNSKSCCGSIKHGGYNEREYHILLDMIKRCYNKDHPAYKNYGGRGITICERWLESDGRGYINFRNDMGYRPNDTYTIERIDNNKGYYLENCIWTDRQTQNQNKRSNTVTYEEVLKIRYDREFNKLSHQELADKYDKKLNQIGKICRYQTWDNIEPSELDIINFED